MNKKLIVTVALTTIAIQILFPEISFAENTNNLDRFANVGTEMDSIKDFAVNRILPFGGAIGTVYGAVMSYMRSSPWPLVIVGAISLGVTLIMSLVGNVAS